MGITPDVLGVLAAGALWRLTKLPPAGRALVRRLGGGSENARTLAGMLLTRGGKQALPLLREAMSRHENLPTVLLIVASIGDPSLGKEVRRFVSDSDPDVARAARDSLRILGPEGT